MAQDQQQDQPLDAIFGTQATVRVLRALAPGDEHAPPRLAVRTGLSRPAVREALIRLEREGIIQRVGTGRHVLYRLASDYPLTKRIVKLFKAEAKRASALVVAAALAATMATRANAQTTARTALTAAALERPIPASLTRCATSRGGCCTMISSRAPVIASASSRHGPPTQRGGRRGTERGVVAGG